MQLLTFNEILTKLCDDFDELISPRRISRTNTNIIYLIFKAIAKGYEIINNVCVTLNNKFDPAYCSSEDLESVATLVGTNRYEGSATGLYIIVTNNGETASVLLQGTYYYKLDDNTTFYFDVLEDTNIEAGSFVTFIAMSQSIGSYPVTAQNTISVTSERPIASGIEFSCLDNAELLGTQRETDLEFRKRILNGVDNQDNIVELENKLKNLPYLFDAKCIFNQTTGAEPYDGISIPAFTLAIFYSGMPRNEIAQVVASKIICPTVSTDDSVELTYENDVFVGGGYSINIIPFKETLFDIDVTLKIDTRYAEADSVEAEIRKALVTAFTSMVHKDYVKENDIYNVIEGLNINGVTLLGANLMYNGSEVEYISVPLSRIPKLENVTFTVEQ